MPKLTLDSLRDVKEGNIGPLEYELKLKKALLRAQLGDLMLNGTMRYSGDWNLHAQKPLWGGMLNLDAQENNGKRNYYLQYEKRF